MNSILALGSLRPPHFTILHRLGKPRLDGLPRPLKIKIHTFLPRLIDLSAKLKADSLMSSFHVRKFETADDRRAGFLARQRLRDAAQEGHRTPEQLEIPRAAPFRLFDSSPRRQETPVLLDSFAPVSNVSPSLQFVSHSSITFVPSPPSFIDVVVPPLIAVSLLNSVSPSGCSSISQLSTLFSSIPVSNRKLVSDQLLTLSHPF